MNTTRTVINAGWRIGLVTAAFVAAAASANAQTPQLGLPVQNPQLLFDGSSASTVKYDGAGNLTVDASAMFLTPKTPTGEQYIMVTVFGGAVAPTNGVCPGNYFYVLNAQNVLSCYTDLLPDGTAPFPPGPWGRYQIRASANPDGTLRESTRGATNLDACGVAGGSSDFCVQGALLRCINNPGNPSSCYASNATNAWQFLTPQDTPQQTLLSGRIRTTLGYTPFGFADHYAYPFPAVDQFEFVFEVTGGAMANLYSAIGAADPRKFVDVQVAGCGGTFSSTTPITCNWSRNVAFSPADHSSLGAGFVDAADGEVDSVVSFPMLVPFDKCNGSIAGKVTDFFSGLGLPVADVQVVGVGNFDVATTGAYSAPGLCGGGSGSPGRIYTVNVLPPTGYLVNGLATQTVTVVTDVNGNDTVVANVNFQLYSSVAGSGAYTTFRQAGWGTKPKGDNTGALLVKYFDLLYPNDLTIGGGFTIVETSAAAVIDFLPQEGRPMPLRADYVDPLAKPLAKALKYNRRFVHHRKLGSLAGETLALELNVRFSAFGITKVGLGSLHLATGKLKGFTVDQVLAMANTVLGGGALNPLLKCYDDLEDIVEAINENFRAGVVNKGYLIP